MPGRYPPSTYRRFITSSSRANRVDDMPTVSGFISVLLEGEPAIGSIGPHDAQGEQQTRGLRECIPAAPRAWFEMNWVRTPNYGKKAGRKAPLRLLGARR